MRDNSGNMKTLANTIINTSYGLTIDLNLMVSAKTKHYDLHQIVLTAALLSLYCKVFFHPLYFIGLMTKHLTF